jgi:SAM-dependent methyltransferase
MTPATLSPGLLPVSVAEGVETPCCLACGETVCRFFLHGEDDLTGRPGRFTYVTCDRCGLVYQRPRLTLEAIRPYYASEYIAHQPHTRWGLLAPLFSAAMASLDRTKLRIVRRHVTLDRRSTVIDVGCGAGSFLQMVRTQTGASVTGVDLIDLADRPAFRDAAFHQGLFYELPLPAASADLVTMWHFLEHDYEPRRSLAQARRVLKPGGHLIIEVPRLDSLSFRLFGRRWPGIQAPQHTALFDRPRLLDIVRREGFQVVEHLPYGAFPPYFYLFCGVAFRLLRGRGLDLQRAIWAYFAGQLLALPLLPFLNRMNFAMQTVVCRREA